jgi:hypothetical protein
MFAPAAAGIFRFVASLTMRHARIAHSLSFLVVPSPSTAVKPSLYSYSVISILNW